MSICKICNQKIRIVVDDEGSFVMAHTTNGEMSGVICENLANHFQAAEQSVHLNAFGVQVHALIPLQMSLFADVSSATSGGR